MSSGHRLLPHTADVIVEAWGSTRDTCLRQAVLGLVEMFADVDGVAPSDNVPLSFPRAPAEELLVALLAEVLYLLDAEDRLPVDVTLTSAVDGGLSGAFHVVSTVAVAQCGAVPKAITHHGLEMGQNAATWHCRVTVDV
jgi:SHS2 domain-containing protein